MKNSHANDPGETQIAALLDQFLKNVDAVAMPGEAAGSVHLDDDSISAFVDGSLSEREARPAVAHLSDCSFCRRKSAGLIQLAAAVERNDLAVTTEPSVAGPSKVSEVLSGIIERIFGPSEAAVFAHSEPENEEKKSLPDDKTKE